MIGYIKSLYARRDDPDCRNRYIGVVIHSSALELQKAAARHSPKQEWDGVLGCFQPMPFASRYDRYAGRWRDSSTPYAGTLRLSEDNLTPEIMTHEAVHAASHLWRLHLWHKTLDQLEVNLGNDCDEDEEMFALLVGALTGSLVSLTNQMMEGVDDAPVL